MRATASPDVISYTEDRSFRTRRTLAWAWAPRRRGRWWRVAAGAAPMATPTSPPRPAATALSPPARCGPQLLCVLLFALCACADRAYWGTLRWVRRVSAVRTVASEEGLLLSGCRDIGLGIEESASSACRRARRTRATQPTGSQTAMRPWTLRRPALSHRPTGMLLVYLPDAKGLLGEFEPACVLGIAQQRESPRTSCITFYHRLTPLFAAGRAT